jgi:hypothetical protein
MRFDFAAYALRATGMQGSQKSGKATRRNNMGYK